MQGENYQKALILLGVVVIGLFGVFTYREIFPEYKKYQDRYLQLEKFKSELNQSPLPFFKKGIKQIVMAPDDKGPERIDRCQSCHVALKLPHFSATKVALDINGKVKLDGSGKPLLVKNEGYIWDLLEKEVMALRDERSNAALIEKGEVDKVNERLERANSLQALTVMEVNGRKVDAKKVLSMHPLIGAETSPFELHSVDEYGCSSCHSGNGRALTFTRAHGPLYDGQYPIESHGDKPSFLEIDKQNDPSFSKMLNHKPAPELLFQTEPVLVGGLIESSCSDCHETRVQSLQRAEDELNHQVSKAFGDLNKLKEGLERDKEAVKVLFSILMDLDDKGFTQSKANYLTDINDLKASPHLLEAYQAKLSFLNRFSFSPQDSDAYMTKLVKNKLEDEVVYFIGREGYERVYASLKNEGLERYSYKLENMLKQRDLFSEGLIKEKQANLEKQSFQTQQFSVFKQSFSQQLNQENFLSDLPSTLDDSLNQLLSGEQLFISQACYSCHMIENFSKGNVGPELTKIGLNYPWYIKESIVWPQADLKTSTMPNFRLDHEEVEDLVTFLLGQKGSSHNYKDSLYRYRRTKKSWEMGALMPWEEALAPDKIKDLDVSRMIFASEGCASCHITKGFDSKVRFSLPSHPRKEAFLKAYYEYKDWFRALFPKNSMGSQIAANIKKYGEEIDKRFKELDEPGIVEKIEAKYPGLTDSYYSNFKFASRARDLEFKQRLSKVKRASEKEEIDRDIALWKKRLHRVKMMYIQEYGYGREVGPNLHYSGIYRDEEWLMGHFKNPQAYIPKSIMPVMPFHETKFTALTYMLQELSKQNLKDQKQYWEIRGFSPQEAYQLHCASCHGEDRKGAGVVAEMLYPIPKNLRSAEFMRKLTKERSVESLVYGVSGTPMAAWGAGEEPVLTNKQIQHLVDWLYVNLPGENFIKDTTDVLKWQYQASDVVKELSYGHSRAEEVFSIQKNPEGSVEPYNYFIKDTYYTPKNIQEGQRLFVLNCAMCHGKEGEGNGDRAEAMVEAKPRALTNVPWLDSRDDLRLLRSIKFGVPGTSMLAWSDRTSGLQRMQMLMFIREMNKEKKLRNELQSLSYKILDNSISAIRHSQAVFFQKLSQQKKSYKEAMALKEMLKLQAPEDQKSILKAFEQELRSEARIKELEEKNLYFNELLKAVETEKSLFRKVSQGFLSVKKEALSEVHTLISKLPTLFIFKDKRLIMNGFVEPNSSIIEIKLSIIKQITEDIKALDREIVIVKAQLPSAEKTKKLEALNQHKGSLEDLQRDFSGGMESIFNLRKQQAELYKKVVAAGQVENGKL